MQKRTFFIGDVHGCYDELIALIAHAGIRDEDEIYFVGDLINKGPQSLEVVEFVRNRHNTFSVMGNHELFTFDIQDVEMRDRVEAKHPRWIDSLKQKSGNLPELFEGTDHVEWLASLPCIIEKDDFIVVHAGLHPDQGIDSLPEFTTLIRHHEGKPWYEYYTGEKLIIYGHWAAEGLRVRSNTIGLDTGCCFGGSLTAYCLETREFYQVRANAVYTLPQHWKRESNYHGSTKS